MQRLATVGLVALGVVIGSVVSEWVRPAAAVAAKPVVHDLLMARNLMLVDEHGTTRAMMLVSGDDVYLSLMDSKGNPRLNMGMIKSVVALSMADDKGKSRVSLFLEPNHHCGIGLSSETGMQRAMLGYRDGESALEFNDGQAVRRFAAGTTPHGVTLQFYDAAKQRTLTLP